MLALFIALGLASANVAFAGGPRAYRSNPKLRHCLLYRAKRADVPVYTEPDATSARRGFLALGEEVCAVGEVRGFAIVEWQYQDLIRNNIEGETDSTATPGAPSIGNEEIPAEATTRAYVRLLALWPPPEQSKKSGTLFELAERLSKLPGSGLAPADPLGTLRPEPTLTLPRRKAPAPPPDTPAPGTTQGPELNHDAGTIR